MRARKAPTAPPFTPDEITSAWAAARAVWDVTVNLSPPEALARTDKDHWGGDDPLAYIDMNRRQVVVNFELLVQIGARASLTAVLAHEIGHHVRHPHTLGLAAQLELLEQRLIPGLTQPLGNLFFDLLINEHVGRTRAGELAAIYAGFTRRPGAEAPGPLFWFYLAIYEELWTLPPGALTRDEVAMEAGFPGCRAEARMFAQTFFSLPDVFLQFVYFCSTVMRYLPPPGQAGQPIPLGRDLPRPDVDDYAGAVYGSPQAERALDEARARGWLTDGNPVTEAPEPLAAISRAAGGRPGTEAKAFREALVSRHYKRLVDQHLIPIPAVAPPPDLLVPTTHSEWQHGDDPRRIDWTASVMSYGPMAVATPLARDLEPEPPSDPAPGAVAVEIYLDTSGSMPNPETALNAMTLAAQILSASAIRKGGKVRGAVYSMDAVVSPWMYDEETARRFLLTYAGGGTRFPFPTLGRWAAEDAGVIRVVITDSDFLYNLKHEPRAHEHLVAGIRASRRFVAMLALAETWQKQVDEAMGPDACALPQLRVVYVGALDRFAAMAADLARALFGG